jgi:hypothetical protein
MGSHILTAHRPHLLHNLSSYSSQLLSHYLVRLTMSQVASIPDVGGTADTGAGAIRSAAARCALGCTPLSELDQQNHNSRFVLLCSLRSQSGKASVPRNQVSHRRKPNLVKTRLKTRLSIARLAFFVTINILYSIKYVWNFSY